MSILKRLFTFAMVVFLLAASGAGAQEPDVPPPIAVTLTAEQARILEGIRANDSRAIRDAGLSRDRIYLEALAGALPRRQNIPGDYMRRLTPFRDSWAGCSPRHNPAHLYRSYW